MPDTVRCITENRPLNINIQICSKGSAQLNIPIDKTVRPIIQAVRRIPFNLRNNLNNKLHDLEDLDIIEKVNEPSLPVSPVVVVPKVMAT